MRKLFIFDPDFIPVLFPEYKIVKEPMYLTGKSIFVGRQNVQGDDDSYQYMRILNRDIDVSIPDSLEAVKFAYLRKGYKFPKSLEGYVKRIEKEHLISELLLFMACGKWIKINDVNSKVYELFAALSESKLKFLHVYFTLRASVSFSELWSAMLTFFKRVLDFDPKDPNMSEYYKKIISRFKDQSGKITKIIGFILSNHYDEMSLLNFVLGVR